MITRSGSHITWFLSKPWAWADPTGFKWYDTGAERNNEGTNAAGVSITMPGIAFPNINGTLGGWWEVVFSDLCMKIVVRQIDIGPKKPVIDLSAPLAFEMFGSPYFPDHSPWAATYLGKTLSAENPSGVFKNAHV